MAKRRSDLGIVPQWLASLFALSNYLLPPGIETGDAIPTYNIDQNGWSNVLRQRVNAFQKLGITGGFSTFQYVGQSSPNGWQDVTAAQVPPLKNALLVTAASGDTGPANVVASVQFFASIADPVSGGAVTLATRTLAGAGAQADWSSIGPQGAWYVPAGMKFQVVFGALPNAADEFDFSALVMEFPVGVKVLP